MNELTQRCVDLLLAADVRVEEWNDGSFSSAFEHAGATWRVHYYHDNDWIALYAPLLVLSGSASAAMLRGVLNGNIDLVFMRYALRERVICLRGDISSQEFNDEEFRLISRIAINAVKHAVEALALTVPPEQP
jgi:hypothetical protein